MRIMQGNQTVERVHTKPSLHVGCSCLRTFGLLLFILTQLLGHSIPLFLPLFLFRTSKQKQDTADQCARTSADMPTTPTNTAPMCLQLAGLLRPGKDCGQSFAAPQQHPRKPRVS